MANVYAMAERSLLGSTRYVAQVRCSVSSLMDPGTKYAGYPSDWSEPVHWTTRPDPASAVRRVYFYLAASVSVTVILTYVTLLAFHRKVKVWEVSLPSPFQSTALKAVCQARGERLSSYTEVDNPCMSEVRVLGDVKQLNLNGPDQDCEDATAPSAAGSTSSHSSLPSREGGCVTGFPQSAKENQAKDTWHFSVPYPRFPAGSSGLQGPLGVEDLLCHGRFMCLAPDSSDQLEPCSDGYQQNPGSSGGAVWDALENVEMHDGYMDCPK
ncbi:uncharacterized protein [Salminus brasiliensis]|uniref:uncharacterized protein n=1 Tax=Salminus brasiliensis TaxID=930266 RepID=UPI003B835779